jgi:hypothetical protein
MAARGAQCALILAFLASTIVHLIQGQISCSNGIIVYEKNGGFQVLSLERAARTIQISTSEVPTSSCRRLCDSTPPCVGFTIDYKIRTCRLFDQAVDSSRLVQQPESAVFLKVCIPGDASSILRPRCRNLAWLLERKHGSALESLPDRIHQNVPDRMQCFSLCSMETAFSCSSATYDTTTRNCSLSRNNRRTHPNDFKTNKDNSDYLESQCSDDVYDCKYNPKQKTHVLSIDQVFVSRTEQECQDMCSKADVIFCRSYSYDMSQNGCFLSSDDSVSLDSAVLPTGESFRYGERKCTSLTQLTSAILSSHPWLHPLSTLTVPLQTAAASHNAIATRDTVPQSQALPLTATNAQQTFQPSQTLNTQGFGTQQGFGNTGFPGSQGFGFQQGFRPETGFGSQQGFGSAQGVVPQQNFASQPGFGQAQGFQPQQNFVPQTGFGSAQGFGTQQTLGSQPGFGSAQGFGPQQTLGSQPGFGSSQGFGPQQTFGSQPGFGSAQGFGPQQTLGSQPGFGNAFFPQGTPGGSFGSGGDFIATNPGSPSGGFAPDPLFPGILRAENPNENDPRLLFNVFNRDRFGVGSAGQGAFGNRCLLEKLTGFAPLNTPGQFGSPLSQFQPQFQAPGAFGSGTGFRTTAQCADWCKNQGNLRCPAFLFDYQNSRCIPLPSAVDASAANQQFTHGYAYFEQICFTISQRTCEGKTWAFDRVPGFELRGSDDRVASGINSRRECEESCLKETQFLCLSAEYDRGRNECRLSRDSRRTRQGTTGNELTPNPTTEYLENQCVPPQVLSSCTPLRQEGVSPLYVDATVTGIQSEEDCRRSCQTFTNFTCHIAGYRASTRECVLSSNEYVSTTLVPDSIILFSSCISLVPANLPFASQGVPFGQTPSQFGSQPGFNPGQFPAGQFPPTFQMPTQNTGFGISQNPGMQTFPQSFLNSANPFQQSSSPVAFPDTFLPSPQQRFPPNFNFNRNQQPEFFGNQQNSGFRNQFRPPGPPPNFPSNFFLANRNFPNPGFQQPSPGQFFGNASPGQPFVPSRPGFRSESGFSSRPLQQSPGEIQTLSSTRTNLQPSRSSNNAQKVKHPADPKDDVDVIFEKEPLF